MSPDCMPGLQGDWLAGGGSREGFFPPIALITQDSWPRDRLAPGQQPHRSVGDNCGRCFQRKEPQAHPWVSLEWGQWLRPRWAPQLMPRTHRVPELSRPRDCGARTGILSVSLVGPSHEQVEGSRWPWEGSRAAVRGHPPTPNGSSQKSHVCDVTTAPVRATPSALFPLFSQL